MMMMQSGDYGGHQNGDGDVLDQHYRGGSGPASTSEPGSAVFVSNLQWWTTDVEIEGLCSAYGTIVGLRFIEDKACGKSRGMCIVDFAEPDAATRCIAGLNGKDINGRHCRATHQNASRGGAGGRAGLQPRGAAAAGTGIAARPGMQQPMVMPGMLPGAMMGMPGMPMDLSAMMAAAAAAGGMMMPGMFQMPAAAGFKPPPPPGAPPPPKQE